MKTADTDQTQQRPSVIANHPHSKASPLAPSSALARALRQAVLAALLAPTLCATAYAQTRSFLLEGAGMRSMSTASDIGEPGEMVTISVQLNSADFDYTPGPDAPEHAFTPNTDVPVNVVGQVWGEYMDVSPFNRFLADERTVSPRVSDRVVLEVGGGQSVASLLSFSCLSESCFDGDVTPFTSEEMFSLFEQAFNDPGEWELISAPTDLFLGEENDPVSFGVVDWTLTDLDPPTSVSVAPTVDVGLTPGATFTLEEGADQLRIDGGFLSAAPEEVLMEFSLEDAMAGASLNSATLTLDGVISSSAYTVNVAGYEGDGLASTADALAPTTELGTSGELTSTDDIVIELDTAFIESLVGEATHLGVRLSTPLTGQSLEFRSSETVLGSPPTLTLDYSDGTDNAPGDFNGDGVVDARDYAAWRDGLGATYAASDYQEWRDNYGQPTSAAGAQHAPEPAADTLLGLAACALSGPYRTRAGRRV